ncbi:uncharacterized protein TNIN_176662 [Trichonephila inaurata madagascariensis]|uniref:Uncharacterized protein n=1 Tax=Trichonephila inaurata madagascariensis TaxID=2747483 RepID=A0A8X6XLM1_9ARAC|nr:uncharacterized protein TNIN_176662 [Trichonephila inaurata madagascariensis]
MTSVTYFDCSLKFQFFETNSNGSGNTVKISRFSRLRRAVDERTPNYLTLALVKAYYNMALTEDSRPFSVLREKAEYFVSLFDKNVQDCQTKLDSQISDLLRDPDSFGVSYGNAKALNAHMEFSKAKYEIFVNMQSLFDKMEANWIECIADMKASFLENVEIFLAGTKLEVKLPSSETLSAIANKRSPSKKSGKLGSVSSSPASSLYPILSSAKKQISRLSSLLPGSEDKDSSDESEDSPKATAKVVRINGKSPKRVTIVTPEEMEVKIAVEHSGESEESESDEEEQSVQIHPRTAGRYPKKSSPSTPPSSKVPVKSSLRKPMTPPEKDSSDSSTDDKSDTENSATPIRGRKSTRSQLSTPTVATPSSTPGRKTRTPRRKTNASEVQIQDFPENKMECEEINNYASKTVSPKTPKNVHFAITNDDLISEKISKDVLFSVGMDINEDLDVYSPEIKIARATPRRKTVVTPKLMENFDDGALTPSSVRGKSKRKTIAGSVLDDSVAPSPKRLKRGGRSSMSQSILAEEFGEANLLEGDGASEHGHYSSWVPLADISGSVPSQPGIYELKVSAAKKPAYIGGCENLRQKLTLHKLKQNSGHKHLDKFIDRNLANILVRYEQLSSAAEAKSEEKNRVKAFVASYKNAPAYN